MCYHPIKSYTNSRYLFKGRSNPFEVQYPCGYCSDCIRKLRSQYSLRAFYEAKDCFSKNGYVLFDTLTYRDSALSFFHDVYKPAINNWWDFKCFNPDHIQKFFARLRLVLKRGVFFKFPYYKRVGRQRKLHKCYKRVEILPAVNNSDWNLRYFLTGEYGSVLKTERPHYHILFYSTLPIDGYTLSKYIYWSWPHGMHDGYGYKSRKYIETKRIINSSHPDNLRLIRYVSKYVSKDMYTYRKLFKRVYMSFTLCNPDWMHSYEKRLEFNRFRHKVLPFHYQSNGFGLAALKYEDLDYIDRYGAIRMPVSDKNVIASIPLSTYYKRKLYYNLHSFDGKLMWLPNQRYYDVLKLRMPSVVDSFARKLQAFDNSKSLAFCRDAAFYQLYQRGRLMPSAGVVDMAPVDLTLSLVNNRCLFNYNSGRIRFFGRGYVSDRHPYRTDSSLDIGYCEPNYNVPLHLPPDLIYMSDSYDEDTIKYGALLDSYTSFQKAVGDNIDFVQRQKDRQLSRYKDLGFVSEFDFC